MARVNLGPAQVELSNLMASRDASLVLTVTDSAGAAFTPSSSTPTAYGFDLGRSAGTTPTAVTIRGVQFIGPHTAAIRLQRTSAEIDCDFASEATTVLTV